MSGVDEMRAVNQTLWKNTVAAFKRQFTQLNKLIAEQNKCIAHVQKGWWKNFTAHARGCHFRVQNRVLLEARLETGWIVNIGQVVFC